MGGGVGGGKRAGQRHHQRHRMLGRGDGISLRRVHHDHAGGRGSGNIDVVDTDSSATYDFQRFCRSDDIGSDFGCGANGNPIVIGKNFWQLFFWKAGFHIGLNAAFAKNGESRGGQRIRDQNFRHLS